MTLLTIRPADDEAPTAGPDAPSGTASPAGAAAPGQLTTTVPREYVHRASHAEVFLTGCRRLDETHYSFSGQWPRAHTFYTTPQGTHHDPLQAAETIRQTGLYLAHAQLGVPLGHHFLLHDLTTTSHPTLMAIGTRPTELTLHATCSDITRKGKRLAAFAMHVVLTHAATGRVYATGGGHFTCLTPATYHRLRHAGATAGTGRAVLGDGGARLHPEPVVAPYAVGKTHPYDVVLSPTGVPGRFLLNPNLGHPVLFDHPGDHFPGMVLIEAARQATHAHTAGADAVTFATVFGQYAELTEPLHVTAARADGDMSTVEVTGRQDGRTVFTTRVTAHTGS
ncbi:ScbA/BarX family gamma-butyrolactone biosynthesis protein [Streptomyces sp. NPDC059785]|uniref:ScbA/BarX family gamma-butyrolactone biosynthesis protein n=1 Tax=unclassified Streptomyces TaxID=2593676 RepID=UPI0036679DAD